MHSFSSDVLFPSSVIWVKRAIYFFLLLFSFNNKINLHLVIFNWTKLSWQTSNLFNRMIIERYLNRINKIVFRRLIEKLKRNATFSFFFLLFAWINPSEREKKKRFFVYCNTYLYKRVDVPRYKTINVAKSQWWNRNGGTNKHK